MNGLRIILKLISSDWFSIVVIALFLFISFVTKENYHDTNDKIVLLGAEYATIAQSLIDGEGYSNPFENETGPTAWMPPMLVFIHVLVFKVFGMSYKAYLVLSTIRLFGYILSFYFLLKAKNLSNIPVSNLILAVLFIFYLRIGGFEILLLSMEHWVYHLIGALLLYGFYCFLKAGKGVILISTLCFIVPIAAPALFIPQAILLAVLFLFYCKQKWWTGDFIDTNIFIKHFFLFGVIATLSVSIWTYRNYKVFDTLIVSKPNTWFEFYLANIKDEKGALHKSTFIKYHPLFNEEICETINEVGEANWLKPFEDSAKIYIRDNKTEYYSKVSYRARNIFYFQSKMDDRQKVQNDLLLNSEDIHTLYNQKTLSGNLNKNTVYWDILQLENDEVKKLLSNAELRYQRLWYDDFLRAKNKFTSFSFMDRVYRFSVAGLPLVALLFIFFLYWKKDKKLLLVLSVFYLIFFVPFILISFTSRYQLFVLEFQTLIVAIFVTYLVNLVWLPINKKFSIIDS